MKRDSEVEQHVLRSFKLDSAITSREICVESDCGLVTLNGTVTSYRESSAIYSATGRTPGVCGVVNKIEVRGGRHPIPEHHGVLSDQPNRFMASSARSSGD